MVKFGDRRGRKQGNKNFRGRSGKKSTRPKDKPRGRKMIKKNISEDQLDRELEMYWGNEVGSKHLDKDMDDYWKNKKDETKE
ncbi:hypothetical protein SteCoe_36862 [Stentor coeruleus]|uniref:Chromatin target of PRMT1 protein C-terminal domain-containing protein n=1 Tax=Stentor coeruleus TaxID=5963 RepID=A0A1R2AP86_9CILI|nr:hypothetical protein SteCoe_36862 [Stentor coeruleus]